MAIQFVNPRRRIAVDNLFAGRLNRGLLLISVGRVTDQRRFAIFVQQAKIVQHEVDEHLLLRVCVDELEDPVNSLDHLLRSGEDATLHLWTLIPVLSKVIFNLVS